LLTAGSMYVGGSSGAAGGSGSINVASGGSLTVNGTLKFWSNDDNATVTGGATLTAQTLDLGASSITGGATVSVGAGGITTTGGSLNASTLLLGGDVTCAGSINTAHFSGAIDLQGATRIFNVADGFAGADAEISGAVSNGGIAKTGAGLLMLDGVNTYTG